VYVVLTVVGFVNLRYVAPDIQRPFRAPLLLALLFGLASLLAVVVPFVPPPAEDAAPGLPYYLAPLIAWVVIAASFGVWYYQVILQDGLVNNILPSSKSYRAVSEDEGVGGKGREKEAVEAAAAHSSDSDSLRLRSSVAV
jgi:hypothetical protein